MEEITNYQAIQLAMELLDFVGVQFQYWLAMTFALIIATYTTGGKMVLPLKMGVGLLYILSSFLFFWMYLDSGVDYMRVMDLLEQRGIDLVQHQSWVTGVFRILIWALGFFFSLGYLFFGEKNSSPKQIFQKRSD